MLILDGGSPICYTTATQCRSITVYNIISQVYYLKDGELLRLRDSVPPSYVTLNGYARLKFRFRGGLYRVSRARAVLMLKLKRDIGEGLMVDHRDRNRINDHPDNLYEVTSAENRANTAEYAHDPDKNVRFEKDRGRWAAFVKKDGVKTRIGRFATKEQAIDARRRYLDEMGYRLVQK